jgi:hypothetical protein
MTFELTDAQVRVLRCQLTARMEELEKEAARTDRHDLQRALAKDVSELRDVLTHITRAKR